MSILDWLTKSIPAPTPRQVKQQAQSTPQRNDANCAYPSIDPGIASREASAIVEANADLVARVKLSYGCDQATFEKNILRLLHRHAAYVNLLPATSGNYFAEVGGLFRMTLEIAFYALQATDSQIFEGRATISSRRQLEPRWRLATFIAGLCGELHRTLARLVVRDSRGDEWPPYLVGLSDWLRERQTDRFFLRWLPEPQEVRATGVFVLPLIIERDTIDYLARENSIVVPHMMASICGLATYREHNILDDLVRRATALVIDQNLQASTERYGKPTLGAHLERYLVDAMRRLVASNPAWQPNSPRARLWHGRDGLYVVWPNGLADVAKLLENEHLPGIPHSPETMLEILIDAGVVLVHNTSRATWLIYPPEAGAPVEVFKLAAPGILLGSIVPAPQPLEMVLSVPRAAAGAPQAAGAQHAASRAHHGGAAPPRTSPAAAPPKPAPAPGAPVLEPVPPGAAKNALVTLDDLDQQARPGLPAAPPKTQRERDGMEYGQPDADRQGGERHSGEQEDSTPQEATRTNTEQHGMAAPPSPRAATLTADQAAGAFPRFSLKAPLGLPSMVAQPLRDLVEELNGELPAPCRTVASGLFIPLTELSRRKLDTTLVLRALDSAGMLVAHPGAPQKTQIHEFGGARVHGLVICPDFIDGLDPNDFEAPGAVEDDDADA